MDAPVRANAPPRPAKTAMHEWTDAASEVVSKISRHANAEVEYRLSCAPAMYRRCLHAFEVLTHLPPRKQVDTILTFVGNVRVHVRNSAVTRIETKQTRLATDLEWGGHVFRCAVAAERPLDPASKRYKALEAAALDHLQGPRLHTVTDPETQVESFSLQPIARHAGVDTAWLNQHCGNFRWRMASKRDRTYVCEPETVAGVFLPFAAISMRAAPGFNPAPAAPALEAPIMVRHRSRSSFFFESDLGHRFQIDCTSAVDVHPKARPQTSIEAEACRPRAGSSALWLPDDVVRTLSECASWSGVPDDDGGDVFRE
jgi:hypothetical protein